MDSKNKQERGLTMRAAALIQLGSKYASVAIQLLITAILARLVSPAEFGTLAIVTVFTSFFSMFADMGIGVAIVQFKDLTDHDMRKLFGFSIVLALGIGVLFCALSLPISWAYDDPALVPLCCVASLSLVFSTLNMVPNGIMLRERKFFQIGLRLVVITLVSGVMGIVAALLGMGVYALVLQIVATSLGVWLWNLASCGLGLPDFHFMSALRRVFSYSAYQFASGLVNYFNRNLDNLLIGRVAGAEMLGYYDKAYKLTTYPMTSFSSVIASVVQPFMAEHQDDKDVIFDCWLRIVKLCSLVGAAVAAVLFCCSGEVVLLMYGEQWSISGPMLHALALGVYAQMMGNPTGAFFQSLGRTDLMFRCGLVNTAIMAGAIVCGLVVGDVYTVSWLVGFAFFGQLASISHFLIQRGFEKSLRCLATFLPETLGLLAAIACGMWVGTLLPADVVWQLGGKIVASMVVLLVVYVATGQMEYLKTLVRR